MRFSGVRVRGTLSTNPAEKHSVGEYSAFTPLPNLIYSLKEMNKQPLLTLLLLAGSIACCVAQPLRETKDLKSITIFERTGRLKSVTFDKDDRRLMARIDGRLSRSSSDFYGLSYAEYYDIFYSNAGGSVNPSGEYLTIEARFDDANKGGGCNITAVRFDFTDGTAKYADYLESFFANGSNYAPSSEKKAVDGNTETHTTMGNTRNLKHKLRLTVGFRHVYVQKATGSSSLPHVAN